MSKKDAEALHEMLDGGVILVDGDMEGTVDLDDDDPVFVALVMDVSSYGPHTASIYAIQNRYHAHSPDAALQPAYEIHEEWMREHYEDHLKELYADAKKEGLSDEDAWQQADEYFRETIDGSGYRLTPMEAFETIRGTDAAKYIGFQSRERNIKIKPYKKK
jgi:hypothetical protein